VPLHRLRGLPTAQAEGRSVYEGCGAGVPEAAGLPDAGATSDADGMAEPGGTADPDGAGTTEGVGVGGTYVHAGPVGCAQPPRSRAPVRPSGTTHSAIRLRIRSIC
jgi:hypothetical protein